MLIWFISLPRVSQSGASLFHDHRGGVLPAYWCPSPPIRARGLQQTPWLRTKHLSLAQESDLRCNQSRSRGERLWGRCDQSTQGALSSRLGKSRFTCLFVYPDPCWRFNVLRSRNLLQEDNGVRAVACRDGWIRAWVSQSWEGKRCRREPKLRGDNRTHSGFATRRSRHYTTAWMRTTLCREDIVHKFRPENVVGIEMLKLQPKNLKNYIKYSSSRRKIKQNPMFG